jgi:hypothetical protein
MIKLDKMLKPALKALDDRHAGNVQDFYCYFENGNCELIFNLKHPGSEENTVAFVEVGKHGTITYINIMDGKHMHATIRKG